MFLAPAYHRPPGDIFPAVSTNRQDQRKRIQAVVALRLLEVIRSQDRPSEVLEAEDPAQTMPRRFGLSDVVERQIRAYREDVRKRVRLTDEEIRDLFRLVIRRPDADEVFEKAGRLLAGGEKDGRWPRRLPRRIQFAVARRRVRKRLQRLFGRRVGGFGRGPFTIEGRALFFTVSDPGGDACYFMSGLCSQILEHTTGAAVVVEHTLCEARGDELCRWEGRIEAEAPELVAPTGDYEDAPPAEEGAPSSGG